MLNVISLRGAVGGPAGSRAERRLVTSGSDISRLAVRVAGLQSKAKEEIHQAIFLLDLAAQHARQIARRMSDPAMKNYFEQHISTIERLLEVARDLTRKL